LRRFLANAGFSAVALLLTPGTALADYCEGRVQAALGSLVSESPSPVGRAERERMQTVLMGLCQDAVQAGGGQAPPAAPVALANPPASAEAGEVKSGRTAGDADAAEEDEEKVEIFGMEIERAEPGSPGHERLRTKR
jgi:hypothetical protein